MTLFDLMNLPVETLEKWFGPASDIIEVKSDIDQSYWLRKSEIQAFMQGKRGADFTRIHFKNGDWMEIYLPVEDFKKLMGL